MKIVILMWIFLVRQMATATKESLGCMGEAQFKEESPEVIEALDSHMKFKPEEEGRFVILRGGVSNGSQPVDRIIRWADEGKDGEVLREIDAHIKIKKMMPGDSGILKYFGCFTHAGKLHMITEYLPSLNKHTQDSMKSDLSFRNLLPLKRLAFYKELLLRVGILHSRGISHRNINAESVLIRFTGDEAFPVLSAFGGSGQLTSGIPTGLWFMAHDPILKNFISKTATKEEHSDNGFIDRVSLSFLIMRMECKLADKTKGKSIFKHLSEPVDKMKNWMKERGMDLCSYTNEFCFASLVLSMASPQSEEVNIADVYQGLESILDDPADESTTHIKSFKRGNYKRKYETPIRKISSESVTSATTNYNSNSNSGTNSEEHSMTEEPPSSLYKLDTDHSLFESLLYEPPVKESSVMEEEDGENADPEDFKYFWSDPPFEKGNEFSDFSMDAELLI
jgi:serine/threonine protein kinase